MSLGLLTTRSWGGCGRREGRDTLGAWPSMTHRLNNKGLLGLGQHSQMPQGPFLFPQPTKAWRQRSSVVAARPARGLLTLFAPILQETPNSTSHGPLVGSRRGCMVAGEHVRVISLDLSLPSHLLLGHPQISFSLLGV